MLKTRDREYKKKMKSIIQKGVTFVNHFVNEFDAVTQFGPKPRKTKQTRFAQRWNEIRKFPRSLLGQGLYNRKQTGL